jgi:DNA-binding MarR family transcriptional regulator
VKEEEKSMKHHDQPSLGRLIACLHRQSRIYFDHALAPFGLSSGTLPLMGTLLRRDGTNQQELSEHLNVDKATITRMVSKLIEQGYVRREQDPDDKRAYRLFATQKARDIDPHIRQVLRGWTEILSDGFTDEEKDQAYALLNRMRDNALRYRKERL